MSRSSPPSTAARFIFPAAPFLSTGTNLCRVKPLWHIGIYGYRRNFLTQFVRWKPTPLEQTEKLEQLRALEHGASIQVVPTSRHSMGVDTPEDVHRAIAGTHQKTIPAKNCVLTLDFSLRAPYYPRA